MPPMTMPGPVLPQTMALRPEAAAAPKLASASLEALALKAGQVLDAKVLGTSANGLTQLAIAGQTLTVRLSLPLPAGVQLHVQVQSGGPQGQPVLVAQTQTAVIPQAPPPPLPAVLQLPLPSPQIAATQAPGGSQPAAAPMPMPSVTSGPPGPPPPGLPPQVAVMPQQLAVASQPQVTGGTPQTMPPVTAQTAQPAAAAAQPVVAAAATPATPAQTATVVVSLPVGGAPERTATARSQLPMTPVQSIPAAPTTLPRAGTSPTPQPHPVPTQANGTPTAVTTAPSSATQAPAAHVLQPPAVPAAEVAPIAGRALPAAVPAAPTLPAAAIAVEAKPAMPTPASAPATVPTSAGRTGQAAARNSGRTVASSPTAMPAAAAAAPGAAASRPAKAPAPAPAVAQPSPAARAPSGSAAEAILGQATQAAARQDSVAPLLQNLAALQGRTNILPQPMAEAAMRLLAERISLDRGPPGGAELKQAVLRSGIFLEATAKPGAMPSPQGDTKGTLLQLRALLGAWLGAEVAPVAPVTRRPPPPTRGAQPRGFKSEMPTLPETATPREAGRALLGQTEAALSRVRLLQLASLPQDAARAAMPGAAAAEWNLELPLLLGHELALAQLQISRDGRGRGERGERGWRMRFSLNFSALGEVGAQVSLFGKSASVAIWAEEAETAAALQEMLPELTPALAAKGLEVGSIRVGQGRPKPVRQPSGQLMDSIR